MTEISWEIEGTRIIVALDASAESRAVLEAAVSLAAGLRAELQGLFVEDDDLLRFAALPIALELTYPSAATRRLDPATVERWLRTTAEKVRLALESTAGQAQVRWSFQVCRGPFCRTMLAAATKTDVLIAGRPGRSSGPLSETRASQAPRRPVLVVYDGTPSGDRALAAAARLAAERAEEVTLVVAAFDGSQAERLQQAATNYFRSRGVRVTQGEQVADAGDLLRAARRSHGKLLLINRDSPLLDDVTVEKLIETLRFPVALVP